MSKTINLPFRQDVPLRDQCSHGKLWTQDCKECEIVSLTEWLEKMEPRIKRDRARLDRLLQEQSVSASGGQ